MKLLLAASTALTLLFPGVALARPHGPPRVSPPLRVSPDLLEVVTAQRGDARVRGIVAVERGVPFVQIDELEMTRRGPVVLSSDRFDAFFFEGVALDLRGASVSNLSFRRNVLAFDVKTDQSFGCRVRLGRRDRDPSQVRCGLAWDDDDSWEPRPRVRPTPPVVDRPHRPQDTPAQPPQDHRPPPPQWAANPEVIRACGDAFIGSNSQRCLDAVRGFRGNPIPAIRACDSAMVGDDNTLACLGKVNTMKGDPVRAIAACDRAMVGDDAALQCLARVGDLYGDPGPIIDACDDAFIGSSALLECVDASASSPGDPVPTIRACADSAIGESQKLACIKSAFRR